MNIYEIICLILLVVLFFWLTYRVDELEDEVDRLKNNDYERNHK